MLKEQCLFLQSVCSLQLALTLTRLSHQPDQLSNTEEKDSLFFAGFAARLWLSWPWGDLAFSRQGSSLRVMSNGLSH